MASNLFWRKYAYGSSVQLVFSALGRLAGSAMTGFSMDKVSVKRRAPSPPLPLAEQSSRKIPKVSDLTVVQGPRPRPPRRPAATGDVVVCLYKYLPCNRNLTFSLRDVPDSLGGCGRIFF